MPTPERLKLLNDLKALAAKEFEESFKRYMARCAVEYPDLVSDTIDNKASVAPISILAYITTGDSHIEAMKYAAIQMMRVAQGKRKAPKPDAESTAMEHSIIELIKLYKHGEM